MGHATDDQRSGRSADDALVATILAAIGFTLVAWEALFALFPALQPDRIALAPSTVTWLYPALYFATAAAFFHVSRRLREQIGVGPFTGTVATLAGLTCAGYAIVVIWQSRPHFEPVDMLIAGTGVVLITLGQPLPVGLRRAAALASVTGAAMAIGLFLGANHQPALVSGVIAILAGMAWFAFRTDFPALFDLVHGQAADEWSVAQSRLMSGVLFATAGIALLGGLGYVEHTNPETLSGARLVGLFALAIVLLLRGLFRLIGVVRRMLGSLVPSDRPNLDVVARQKVHGSAGFAGAEQIDAALRDQDLGGAQPRFRD